MTAATPDDYLEWTNVDPAGCPFDPVEARALIRSTVRPSVVADDEAVEAWRRRLGEVFAARYGSWARGWQLLPGPLHYWFGTAPVVGSPQVAELVADALIAWRDHLDRVAAVFERFLPIPAGLAVWEAALSQVVAVSAAHDVDGDGAGYAVPWFLEAAGIEPERRRSLLSIAFPGSEPRVNPPTTAELEAAVTRLARAVHGLNPEPDHWPDTWPGNWPSWRTTNR